MTTPSESKVAEMLAIHKQRQEEQRELLARSNAENNKNHEAPENKNADFTRSIIESLEPYASKSNQKPTEIEDLEPFNDEVSVEQSGQEYPADQIESLDLTETFEISDDVPLDEIKTSNNEFKPSAAVEEAIRKNEEQSKKYTAQGLVDGDHLPETCLAITQLNDLQEINEFVANGSVEICIDNGVPCVALTERHIEKMAAKNSEELLFVKEMIRKRTSSIDKMKQEIENLTKNLSKIDSKAKILKEIIKQ